MGFKFIAQCCTPASVVVWLNEYFGPVEVESQTGTTFARERFTEMNTYEASWEDLCKVIAISEWDQPLFRLPGFAFPLFREKHWWVPL